ncbi:hypothetical protein ASG30_05105 [Ramlibacter sp. Leaf400]|nr:hypothetical protein ASG30_05105 [Ramlibacter sp. Leaf400]
MLTSDQVCEPGFYRYYDAGGHPVVVVEIAPAEAPEPHLEVRFEGREEWVMLADLSGRFEGPLRSVGGS